MRRAVPALTPSGIGVTSGAVALMVVGWALGYPTLTIAGAGAVAAVIGCGLVTFSVPRLEVSRLVEPSRVQRGSPAHGLVAVRNPSRRRSRGCTAVEFVAGDEVRVEIPALRGGRSISVPYALPTRRRGALSVGPLTITRRDPLGFWQAERPVGGQVTLIVEPRILPIPPRAAGRTRHMEGPVSDTAPRGTQVFHSLREYTAGDDVRRIHWRSSARTGTLMVREHVDTSLPSTVVVLDIRADRYEGDEFEEAVDVAASVVAASKNLGFPVRVVTTTGTNLITRAGQRGQDINDFLAVVQTTPEGGDLRRATTTVVSGRDHDVIVAVSGRVDAVDGGEVTLMTRRFNSKAFATIRPAGSLPRWSGGAHLDGATAAEALSHWGTPVLGSSLHRPVPA